MDDELSLSTRLQEAINNEMETSIGTEVDILSRRRKISSTSFSRR